MAEAITTTLPDLKNEKDGWSISAPSFSPLNRALLGMLIFLGTEVMFFGGLISVFLILRAGNPNWPPSGQPRLPVAVTAINTLFLLASAYTSQRALNAIRSDQTQANIKWLLMTAILGAIFLAGQGSEWLRLVRYGLTFRSSIYGGTFYTIIGCHALHVLGAMVCLLMVLKKALARSYSKVDYTGVALFRVYWIFVVGIWPVLYVLVYLS
jgi:cytochrome c oxidase subunit 3